MINSVKAGVVWKKRVKALVTQHKAEIKQDIGYQLGISGSVRSQGKLTTSTEVLMGRQTGLRSKLGSRTYPFCDLR